MDTSDDTRPRIAAHPPEIIGFAWPTGRPIYAFTAEEIAHGVDVYTRAMKARAARDDQQ